MKSTLTDYRAMLREELHRRKGFNPRYSLRAMARDLDVAPARLSDVLRGRYGLSVTAARRMAGRLGWSAHERAHFENLVEAPHGRSPKKRAEASKRVHDYLKTGRLITFDNLRVMSDWYYFALAELTRTQICQNDPRWVAKRLSIDETLASIAIERLKRLGLIQVRKHRLVSCQEIAFTSSEIPSSVIKGLHQQILDKGSKALYLQEVEERDFSSFFLTIDPKDMVAAKKMIRQFRRSFNARFGSNRRASAVYALAIQFFRLDSDDSDK